MRPSIVARASFSSGEFIPVVRQVPLFQPTVALAGWQHEMGQDNRLIPGTAPTTATAATATATLAAMTASSTASPAGALFARPGLVHR